MGSWFVVLLKFIMWSPLALIVNQQNEMKENRIPQKELEKIHSQCLRVRERVNASRGEKGGSNDVSLVFFPDDQTRIRVVEEFLESVTHRPRANRNLAARIKEQRKPRPTWREVKEKYLLETDRHHLERVDDDFIHY